MTILQVLAGGILGAVALSVFTLLFHWLFFRRALGDGQYMIVFFAIVPIGIILGAITGLVLAKLSMGHVGTAGHIALYGGGVVTIIFLLLGLFVHCGTEKPTLWNRLTATLFWFGLPLLWSVILLKAGLRLLAHR